jgi:hypothetical protein
MEYAALTTSLCCVGVLWLVLGSRECCHLFFVWHDSVHTSSMVVTVGCMHAYVPMCLATQSCMVAVLCMHTLHSSTACQCGMLLAA